MQKGEQHLGADLIEELKLAVRVKKERAWEKLFFVGGLFGADGILGREKLGKAPAKVQIIYLLDNCTVDPKYEHMLTVPKVWIAYCLKNNLLPENYEEWLPEVTKHIKPEHQAVMVPYIMNLIAVKEGMAS